MTRGPFLDVSAALRLSAYLCRLSTALPLALALLGVPRGRGDVLVAFGADWRFYIGLREASSPVDAWRKVGFNDQSWQSGPSPIGYGEPDIATAIPSSAQGNWMSVYSRRTFTVANPASVTRLDLDVRIDDGFVAWINGVEIGRSNVADGQLPFGANALSAIEPVQVAIAVTNGVADLLVPGTNVLAIQAFNANSGSSDLLLDAQLITTSDLSPPQVAEVVPAPGSTVRTLQQIDVYFDESVVGVTAGDLLINGQPATGMTAVSPREYIFSFSAPPPGRVEVRWTASHDIRDLATPANPFIGGAWTYQLDPTAPASSVIISEFLADNTAGAKDEDGRRSDWIELLNLGADAVNLDGWSLTDDPARLTKWHFPPWTLAPNAYLLVWASEKDQTNAAPLHTNFKLDPKGEYLALVDPQTNIVSEFAPAYPPQQPNISYGRDRLDPKLTGYFVSSTPGQANAASGPGFAPSPEISLASGSYTSNSVTVSLSAPDGEIHYTLDGAAPLQSSPTYTEPLTFTVSTILQARVFQAGLLPSEIVLRVYTLLNADAAGFSSNLPILVIQTGGHGIAQDQRSRAFVSTFEPKESRARLLSHPDFESAAQIEVRGQTSAGFPKQPYNLEIDDPYGNDWAVPLAGLPKESDWVLHNPYSDKCLMNNFLAFELHRKMGHYAPRCRFVEVFVKTSRNRLSYPADYRGVYVLMEKIKVDRNRVDLTPLSAADNQEPAVSGGYIIKKDKDSPGDLSFSTQGGGGFGGQYLKYHEPKPREITAAQRSWIVQYLNQFERCLYATDWLRRTGTNHYSNYIDVDSFVDNHWIVEFTKQIDGYRLSNYLSKDRGGKLKMEPIWDWNLAFGNADYLEGWNTEGWYYPQLSDSDHIWLRRLISGTTDGYARQGDPDFNQRIIDRWSVLRTNILAASNVVARINEIAALLDEAQARDFAKYPRLDTYVWPNPWFYIAPAYSDIIAAMNNWVTGRFEWIDSQMLKTPQFSHPGGPIQPGFELSLAAPSGTIMFTLDGTDPRLPGSSVNPLARTYSGPIRLLQNARVVARARNGNAWSGPGAATFVTQTPPLVITELMYHPARSSTDATNNPDALEFVELKNIGASPLDLSGFRFLNGVDYTFSPTSAVTRLDPGARVLIVKDRAAFAQRYPSATAAVAGVYSGSLENGGERLALEGSLGEPVLNFQYDSRWFPITDGLGFSLVSTEDAADMLTWGDPAHWRVSSAPGGSPGLADPPPARFPAVLINEVLSRPLTNQVDAIELVNASLEPADITGWFLTDDFSTPLKFKIPAATVIAPGQFRTFGRSEFDAIPGFALSADGDEVYLFSGDGASLTGYMHGFHFGGADRGVTFGRVINSAGEEHFAPQIEPTLGAPNAGPRVGPVVINEIMFNPPGLRTSNGSAEFIELRNVTDQSWPLFDPLTATNTWRLSGGVDFDFPTGVSLGPGEIVLVVNFDPTHSELADDFRARYALNRDTPLFGPYGGNLDNAGERLTLSKPALFPTGSAGMSTLGHVVVDEVHYRAETPWPGGAGGTGKSLQRIESNAYGDEPLNWLAAAPTPGARNAGIPAGALRVVIEPMGAVTVRLSFHALAGARYRILESGDLERWHPVQEFPPGLLEHDSAWEADASARCRFYRLAISEL